MNVPHSPLTLRELMTCKGSSPGSDGLSYGIYIKKLWGLTGSFILNLWKYSCEIL